MTLDELYKDLHSHPELAFSERRTAGLAAEWLAGAGFAVTAGLGGTGVAGVLSNGDGPTVLVRADMDALPLREETGLDYASDVVATDARGERTAVMHAWSRCRDGSAGNHSPQFAPLIEPTLTAGVNALVTAVRDVLPAA